MSNYIHNIGDVIETPKLDDDTYLKNIGSSNLLTVYTHGNYKIISSNVYYDNIVGKFLFEDDYKDVSNSNSNSNLKCKCDTNTNSNTNSNTNTNSKSKSDIDNQYKLKFETLILYNNKIVGFFPPNPLSFEMLYDTKYNYNIVNTKNKDDTKTSSRYEIYEWIEGYKICLFYNGMNWEISTNKEVQCMKQINKKTLRNYFYDCLYSANIELEQLNKSYSYIFQIQHPELDHVCKVYLPTIYLLNVFNIFHDDGIIFEYNIDKDKRIISLFQDSFVCTPAKKEYIKIHEAIEECTKLTKQNPLNKGYIIKSNLNDDFIQYFFVESSDYVYHYYIRKHMKKIEIPTELELQYYSLRQYNLENEYINLYPEIKDAFDTLNDRINRFCNELYYNYIECYIYKEKDLMCYPYNMSVHMKRLHDLYLRFHIKKKDSITLPYVKMYVNTIQPIRLKHCINNIK